MKTVGAVIINSRLPVRSRRKGILRVRLAKRLAVTKSLKALSSPPMLQLPISQLRETQALGIPLLLAAFRVAPRL